MTRRPGLQTEIPFEALDPEYIRMEGARKQALDQGRTRLLVTGVMLALAFVVLGGRLIDLTQNGKSGAPQWRARALAKVQSSVVTRGNVVDRNGNILATSLPTQSLYMDAQEILAGIDPGEAVDKLIAVLPDLNRAALIAKLEAGGRFQWVSRNLTPDQVWAVNRLGLPGFGFRDEERRVYPYGPTYAHVLGYTDVDGRGLSGIERKFDDRLGNLGETVELSIDMRVQSILYEEVSKAKARFSAIGASGVVMDASSGEVIAMVSLPDFDPNQPSGVMGTRGFNRATLGVYEMGSTFKLFTTAMALDTGTVDLTDGYDASEPIRIARFTISDYHGKKRWLSVPEILVYSSNIGTAKMAVDVGAEKQKEYLTRLGLLGSTEVELPELGTALYPARWSELSTMTISYGHGIAVSPLQLVSGVSALVNGGVKIPPTLLKRSPANPLSGTRVLKPETSKKMRSLMRMVVRSGTGKKADVQGYLVGGKTGTADKQVAGRYDDTALISSFVGAFPMIDPRYVVLVLVDEPKGIKETFGFATGGWVAAPAVKAVIERMGPLFGVVADGRTKDAEENPGHPLFVPATSPPKRPEIIGEGVRRAIY